MLRPTGAGTTPEVSRARRARLRTSSRICSLSPSSGERGRAEGEGNRGLSAWSTPIGTASRLPQGSVSQCARIDLLARAASGGFVAGAVSVARVRRARVVDAIPTQAHVAGVAHTARTTAAVVSKDEAGAIRLASAHRDVLVDGRAGRVVRQVVAVEREDLPAAVRLELAVQEDVVGAARSERQAAPLDAPIDVQARRRSGAGRSPRGTSRTSHRNRRRRTACRCSPAGRPTSPGS